MKILVAKLWECLCVAHKPPLLTSTVVGSMQCQHKSGELWASHLQGAWEWDYL